MSRAGRPAGPCARDTCEPGQVRKEAAINGPVFVPQISLAGLPARFVFCKKKEFRTESPELFAYSGLYQSRLTSMANRPPAPPEYKYRMLSSGPNLPSLAIWMRPPNALPV